jgi:hypothetical protein
MQSRTIEEIVDMVTAQLGLESDPLFASRVGAVLFGGRPATEEDLERAETFREEVEHGLRRRHGRAEAVLTLYGVPHLRPAGRAARERYRVPNLRGTGSSART